MRSIRDRKAQLGMDTAKNFVLALLILIVVGVTTLITLNALGDATDTSDSNSVTNETGWINETIYTVGNANADGFSNFQVTQAYNRSDDTTISSDNYNVDSSAGTVVGVDTTRTVTNETGAYINTTGYTVADASVYNADTFTLTALYNSTDGSEILLGNASINSSTGVITNATTTTYTNVSVSYTYSAPANYDNASISYTYDTDNEVANVVENTSTGIGEFFSNSTTWLALLSVVIIILIISAVIVVVNQFGMEGSKPALGNFR